MTTPATTSQALFGVGDVSPVTQAMEVLSSTLKRVDTHTHSPGLRGTRSRHKNRNRKTRTQVAGAWDMEPTPTEIDWWLEKILGGTAAAGVTDVAEALPAFYAAEDHVTKVPTFSGLRVAVATLSGASGEAIKLNVEMEGTTEVVGAAASFPSLTLPTDNFFVFSDIVLTLEGTARDVDSFTLKIDNRLLAELWRNSLTREEIPAGDRLVTLSASVPYHASNSDLYDAAIAGAAMTLVISDGTTTYTLASANAKIPPSGPDSPAKGGEFSLDLQVDLFADDDASELKVTKT
jgi:hypothetical protein